jgi:penicillin amidase
MPGKRLPILALAAPLLSAPPAAAASERDTTWTLPGLSAPVAILTDPGGIPHLRAANLSDLYFAWGFVSARDRLWQMEHTRRGARGQLWRWFGNRALRADGGAQLFELAALAERSWAVERDDAGTRLALERFAEGVNAYLDLCRRGLRPWPSEFRRLGVEPEDWRPVDCILALVAMGVLLDLVIPELAEAESVKVHGPGWFERRRRFESDWTYTTIPDSAARRLYGGHGPSGATAPPPADPLDDLEPRPERPPPRPAPPDRSPGAGRDPDLRASNLFAVGPERSASRAPLLANDVHLALTAPGPLYALHVSVPDTVDAAGAGVPGLPIIVSGRNRHAAWGVTSLAADVIDVYADTLSRDGRAVLWQGRWVPLREEPYDMRFRALGVPLPPFGQKRRYTPRGPVLDYDRRSRLALSARWTALEGDLRVRGVIGLERSRDAAEVARRCRTLLTPTLNVVAADVQGRVLYQTVGAVPRRGFAHARGVFPADGRHEWLGVIPPEEMPAWEAPPDGFVVSGNNLPAGPPYPGPWPRYDWIHDRAARMAERLAGDPEVSLADARSVQNDVHSRAAARLVPLLVGAADSLADRLPPTARAALDALRRWNHACLRSEVAPTLFRAWLGAFLARYRLADVPGLAVASLSGRAPDALRDERGAPERPARAAARSLEDALGRLAERLGPELATWTWGRAHRARFRHALEWRDPRFLVPAVPMDGDNSSPSVGPSRLPGDIHVAFGPAWRHLVDLAVPDSSLCILPPGNTGTPAHDRDHLQRWANHRYVPLHLDWARIEAARESAWRLSPGD